ncbi:YceI family protein [Niabella drilacis]|uniref:Polyisoprenoid-binding protein YceI n=1 Tax=Niabella drilacis (strain DSM 25811 / CCM 8410 / CCUG 62505 / LMG 26954 / E90) TaxID=1285928 RepID=A0A1G6KWI4_NIADE|nr:YceI family protein [Niabella drilacis]SDC35141.1 Polyisoprenoid-binding protein YceI [Niabella drilacis]
MRKIVLLLAATLFLKGALPAQSLKPVEADSKVAFVIRNMGMDVEGSLKGLKGTININPADWSKSAFDVTVDLNTISTGIQKRDNHLKQADFFDAAQYPEIRIQSTRILPKQGNVYYAEATLTMHGISKSIKFDFIAKPADGGYLLTSNFSLNRLDYKIGRSSITMADKVTVMLSVLAKK